MDNENRNSPVGWVAEIPPHRWWRVGVALGLFTAAAGALLLDAALAWIARWPRCGPDETRR